VYLWGIVFEGMVKDCVNTKPLSSPNFSVEIREKKTRPEWGACSFRNIEESLGSF
jgi:hypothetical protein